MKCVMILDGALPAGILANTASALALSLGSHVPGLVGPDLTDKTGFRHRGITAVPIPVLESTREEMKSLNERLRSEEDGALVVLGFNTVAQRCHRYEQYVERLSETESEALEYLGLCIYGPRKRVDRLCGRMKLLR